MREMAVSSRDKQAKFQAVADAIFQILIRGGIENLSHTRVALTSGVSRAWIYKYIGKTSAELIAFSLDAIGKEFAKFDALQGELTADDVRKSLFEGTFRMLTKAANNPAILTLYYRYHGSHNPIGRKIAEIEGGYTALVRTRLEKHFGLTKAEASIVSEVLHGFRMGLAHRYSSTELRERTDFDGIQKAIRRVFKHFAIEDQKGPSAKKSS
jgi:hypothetical protein